MYLNICTGHDVPKRLMNLREKHSHRGTAITGQLNNCDFASLEILLIAKVFVRREKYFEPCGLGRFQKHAVFKTPRPCFSAVQTSCPLR